MMGFQTRELGRMVALFFKVAPRRGTYWSNTITGWFNHMLILSWPGSNKIIHHLCWSHTMQKHHVTSLYLWKQLEWSPLREIQCAAVVFSSDGNGLGPLVSSRSHVTPKVEKQKKRFGWVQTNPGSLLFSVSRLLLLTCFSLGFLYKRSIYIFAIHFLINIPKMTCLRCLYSLSLMINSKTEFKKRWEDIIWAGWSTAQDMQVKSPEKYITSLPL